MPNPEMKTLTVGENTFDIRDGRIGDLADLDTTDKSSVVAAINEAAQGSGGTTDYTDLTNKPSINSVTLSGNKTAADLSLASAADVADLKSAIDLGSITPEIKTALLACFENVAWINDQGQDYYDALYAALYPPVDVLSISAVFTQGDAVIYNTDSLDDLKQYLVVTATMTDSTTQAVTDYTLSGTLTEGTSTITVMYGGKTTTFNVTVTALPVLENKNYLIITENETPVSGYIGDDGSVVSSDYAYFINKLYPIKSVMFVKGQNPNLSILNPGSNCAFRFAYYDLNGNFLSRNYANSGYWPVVPSAPSGAAYMKIGWSGSASNPDPDYVLISDDLANSYYPTNGYVSATGEIAVDGPSVHTTDMREIPSGYNNFAITPYVEAKGVASRIAFFDSSQSLLQRYYYSSIAASSASSVFIGSIPQGAKYYRMTKADGKNGVDMVVMEG